MLTVLRETRLYDLFHKIDYETYKISLKQIYEGGQLGADEEKSLIFFLDFLNGVCAAFEANILDEEYLVMSSLGYAVQRTADNAVVKAYLTHLRDNDDKLGFNRSYSLGQHVRSIMLACSRAPIRALWTLKLMVFTHTVLPWVIAGSF